MRRNIIRNGTEKAEPRSPRHEISRAKMSAMNVLVRKALVADVPRLKDVIEASVRGLQAQDYSPAQIEGALKSVYGVDSQLIADGTYFAVELAAPHGDEIVACGGWSKRRTLYGGDQFAGREDSLLD